ncbi:DUF952 domain-containing protein [Labrys monachus]|uniref:Uncharacterized protein (DUF952 family) n=1 Tax=Labrys monachus TaxID=217067 RepID=A0ABU0FE98_9HYPH|nr:DUF952 domain-containing protein [Labrys monachus]MDQ0392474.1 uncharacterized protein (DUF952 family) [Labrys monachus]
MKIIYKIATAQQWRAAEEKGRFDGAPVDIEDGFIHFSDAATVRETAARHFAAQEGLVLAAVDAARLGDTLKWEVSRGGALFPHLYAFLPLDAVLWTVPLPLDGLGGHLFPTNLP